MAVGTPAARARSSAAAPALLATTSAIATGSAGSRWSWSINACRFVPAPETSTATRNGSPMARALDRGGGVAAALPCGLGGLALEAQLGGALGHGDRVLAREAGPAVAAGRPAERPLRSGQRQVGEAGGADGVPHLVQRVGGRDQLVAVGEVDPVVAGPAHGRARYAQVHLGGAGLG